MGKITQAILHITYVCSHHCPMCYANANTNIQHPKLEQLCKIVDKLIEDDVMDITLVGGDPAIYPDIVPLVHYCYQNGEMLSILSNTLDFGGKKEQVADKVQVFEGTIHHSSPLYHDNFCGVTGAYDNLIKNLKYFSDCKKSVGLAINIIPYNYEVLFDLVKNVIEQGVNIDHIILQRIIQFGRAIGSSEYEITCDMLNKALEQIERIELELGVRIIFEDPVPVCSIKEKFHRFMHPCEWGITKISLDYDGNISRCGTDVFHTIGSIFEQDIQKTLNENLSITQFREKGYLPIKCKQCDKFGICGGGCPISRAPEKGYTLDYLAQ